MKKPPLPPELFSALDRAIKSAHLDENQGVAIGARSTTLAVLALYDREQDQADRLGLWHSHSNPSEWAAHWCENPVRAARGPYVAPGAKVYLADFSVMLK